MNVTTTYCYIGDGTVVEFVTTYSENSTNLTVNVLPPDLAAAAPVAPPPLALPPESPPVPAAAPEPDPAAEEEALQLAASSRRPKRPPDAPVEPQEPVLAAPLPEAVQCAAEPPLTKKRRSFMGAIRAGWFILFTGTGAAVDYGIQNLTTLELPPGTATAVGAGLYGLKRALWPDTTL